MYSDHDLLAEGLPHSDIHGSKPARGSPWLFAACHVLHRLLVPRHPPNALRSLIQVGVTRFRRSTLALRHRDAPHHDKIRRRSRRFTHHAQEPSIRTTYASPGPDQHHPLGTGSNQTKHRQKSQSTFQAGSQSYGTRTVHHKPPNPAIMLLNTQSQRQYGQRSSRRTGSDNPLPPEPDQPNQPQGTKPHSQSKPVRVSRRTKTYSP